MSEQDPQQQQPSVPVDLSTLSREDLIAHGRALGFSNLKGSKAQIIAIINGENNDDEDTVTHKYVALRQVMHNGVHYPIGGELILTDDEAADLLVHGNVTLTTIEVPVD